MVPRPDRGDRRAARCELGRQGARGARTRRRCCDLKRKGFSDRRLAQLLGTTDERGARNRATRSACARSTSASTPARPSSRRSTAYLYSTYEEECEAEPTDRKKIMVLGGGPNRIGQGIEFDYCCVHAALALREDGFETIMVNCNPETVSTDYDTSDRLYFEPLTLEDVLEIVDKEKPGGRDRAVRRPDAAQARARPGGGRRADHRHQRRLDRRRRGPRALPAAAAQARACASRRTAPRARRRRRSRSREEIGYPRGGAPELRARRPRDGDRARASATSSATCARR